MGLNDTMRIDGLRAIVLAASLALAGGVTAQAQQAPAAPVVEAPEAPAPVAVDELIRQSGQGAAAIQLALLELELAGRLVRHAAGRVSLVGGA